MSWSKQIRYRFGDIDDGGIAYFPKLLHVFHCVFEDWWSDALGHPYAQLLKQDRLGMPTVSLTADFYSPVRYGDEPVVHLGVVHLGRSSIRFAFWMTKPESDVVLCRAIVTAATVDMDRLTSTPLPDDLRAKISAYCMPESELPDGRKSRGK